MRLTRPFLAILLSIWAGTAVAQNVSLRPGGFLVIDQDAIFSQSLYGQRILSDTDAATAELVAENRQIETTLIAEERDLTDRRPGLAAEEFRQLADAFDERVQRIRSEQSAKSDAIGARLDDARREFFQAIVPVLAEILREYQAVAILDKRTVLLSINLIDVTDLAVQRIDERLGEGNGQQE